MNAMGPIRGYLRRACPCCGEPPPLGREAQSEPAGERLPFKELAAFWIGLLKRKVFFSYGRCPGCGLLYAPVFFDEEQLAQLYARMPPNMGMVARDALERTQRGYVESLRKRGFPSVGAYLEVGPDIGLFAEACVAVAEFNHHWLLEPNHDVVPQLGAIMASRPHTIIESMSGFDLVPDGSVSVAVMVHVLDHMIDPALTLSEIRRKMTPGGVLLVVTHDESSLLRRLIGARWPPFCLQHPQLFNRATLKIALQSSGFTDVAVARSVNYFSLAFLIRQGLWALRLRAPRLPRLLDVTVGLKLGNMIALAEVDDRPARSACDGQDMLGGKNWRWNENRAR